MDAFAAVADPTRRAVLDLLIKKQRSAGDLVSAFPTISQPAVSKHLRILRNAGLVDVQIQSRRRIYSLKPKPLTELDAWVSKYRAFWSDRLNALERHLSLQKKQRREKL